MNVPEGIGRSQLDLEEVDAIRFALGSVGGARSSTWRVWGNKKGDFYLATRTLGGIGPRSWTGGASSNDDARGASPLAAVPVVK